jgi:aminopeptidase N
MFRSALFLSVLLLLLSSCFTPKTAVVSTPETGVSRSLAAYRKSVLADIHYLLELDIPAQKDKAITAHEILSFTLGNTKNTLQLDFKEDPAKITSLIINGKKIAVNHQKEHLLLLPEYLHRGSNKLEIFFVAGNGALNRNTDYLYTLFVPDRARTVFPCFDQPDLKATYTLTLEIPAQWKAIANAGLQDSLLNNTRKTYHYKKSDLLSTYLFAFAAGDFKTYSAAIAGGQAEFLYRETDKTKIGPSLPIIYAIHQAALKYYEEWTAIPYPFQKFGFVAIPDFQFGGMEHLGAIQYKASSLFLDAGATKDQINSRNNLIAHETAHMWFGDMVTMDWFSDVWMKEVFANFMADKSGEGEVGKEAYDLKFLIDHFPAAYAVDRTTDANPIRQPLDNLKDAGTLYGNIIYHKAPIMMQQLEGLMGKDAFREGVREYLRKFTNRNASWPDLIQILDRYTPADLEKWNKTWVNESGRPVISYSVAYKNGQISAFAIDQHAERGHKRVWPQMVEIGLFYKDSIKTFQVALQEEQTKLKAVIGLEKPDLVLFNSAGDGYGRWPVDVNLPQQLLTLKKPIHRATAYISLYEQMLSGEVVKPVQLLTLFVEAIGREQEELNIKLLSGYISTIYWQFIRPEERQRMSPFVEARLWSAQLAQRLPNHKKQLFKCYQDVFLSGAARDRLYQVWKEQRAPAGIILSEDDYTSLALSLALRDDPDPAILAIQDARITNSDRKKRFEFIMPAVSSKKELRNGFFAQLKHLTNREKESNVLAALYYLHHPLRQASGVCYLKESLELLEEIQRTGDIFFPQSWLQATLGTYQSAEATQIVRDFLAVHPDYNPRLKAKILQAADNLFRARHLIE